MTPRCPRLLTILLVALTWTACGADDDSTGPVDGSADATDSTGDVGTPDDADSTDAIVDADADLDDSDDGSADSVDDSSGSDAPDIEVPPFDPDGDTDGDGIPDAVEGEGDPDNDGRPNYFDTDSDGDVILDSIEGTVDSDEDGIPNYLDTDSDNDTVPDRYESEFDSDEDGTPNYLDLDSDNDGWSDSAEYGQLPDSAAIPRDTDNDGLQDFLDLDSDADGLGDDIELGCPASTDRLFFDSDGDGVPDPIEVAFDFDEVNQACDADDDITDNVDFFFTLDFEGPEASDELEFEAAFRGADLVFNMDTTGSMGGSIARLQTSLTSVLIPAFATALENPGYAVTQFDDFPCNGHGSGEDRPLILRQRVTTSTRDAENGVEALELHSGGDINESGIEALYQIATGNGRSNGSSCLGGATSQFIVRPFDPAIGFQRDIADGTLGGVGFREGSVPIIFHISDAPTHAKGENTTDSGVPYQYGATRIETYNALDAIGARVIGVAAGSSAPTRSDLEALSFETNSAVPACAWDSSRPPGCRTTECCTGPDGDGRPAIGGVCPLVYNSDASGNGLDTSIVSGIRALLSFSTLDLLTRVRPDEVLLGATGIDTTCFIREIVPIAAVPPEGECVSTAEIADLDRDGARDGFRNVTPGSTLSFEVIAQNDCVPGTDRPQVFEAYIDVVELRGAGVYDTRLVTILVPPAAKQ